jgi:NADPH:quinone reductase-like Zn-dependent oxidoreductase
MKAVRLYEYGGPEKLVFEEDVPVPPLPPQNILVKTAAASVNPIDWKVRSGARQKDFPRTLPTILGRDVSGIVCAIGSEVRNFKVGDRVLALADATYAEFVSVEASLVTHLPDGVDLQDAAAIPLIALTADQLVRLSANIQKGQTVVVTGALGSVGRAAVHTAKKIGARVIAAVRLRQLKEADVLGASSVVAIDDDESLERLVNLDAVADTVGGEAAVRMLARIRDGGSFGYASVLPQTAATQYPNVRITRVFAKPDPSKIREFADDVRDGKFSLPIGARMPFREAAEAHRLGEKGGIGKILLLPPDMAH